MVQSITPIGNALSMWQSQGTAGAGGFQRVLEAGAEYLGLSAQDLQTQLKAGKSLADVAQTQGKSVDGLKEALQAVLPNSTQDADITSSILDRIVNAHRGGHKVHHHRHAQQAAQGDGSQATTTTQTPGSGQQSVDPTQQSLEVTVTSVNITIE